MQISVQVKGLDELLSKFNRLDSGVQNAILDATEESERYLLSQIPPPPPPTLHYQRTGLLENSFMGQVVPLSRGSSATISNPTSYAPWVISDSRIAGAGPQAGVHRGRWYTLQQVLKNATAGIVQIYDTALKGLIESG